MNPIEVIGWCANAAFFARFLVQWWASERAGRSVVPRSFWWISIAGHAGFIGYCVGRGEPVLLAGSAVNAAIVLRNLQLCRDEGPRRGLRLPLLLLSCAAATAVFSWMALENAASFPVPSRAWFLCAVVGQLLWSGRFVAQWWSSERAGVSRLPRAFWWLSLGGNALLLAYAIHRRDAVIVAGFALGPVVQLRNLFLSSRRARGRPFRGSNAPATTS